MILDALLELLVAALVLAGSFFLLVGSFGLAKLPSLVQRLHAPTKSSTLGVGGLLVASMLHFTFGLGTLSLHELLITLFLFLSAPVTAHMIAKAHYHRDRFDAARLPPTGTAAGWATIAPPSGRKTTGRAEGEPREG
jgi:multicomponent K+:H+ antiporter subunit G